MNHMIIIIKKQTHKQITTYLFSFTYIITRQPNTHNNNTYTQFRKRKTINTKQNGNTKTGTIKSETKLYTYLPRYIT